MLTMHDSLSLSKPNTKTLKLQNTKSPKFQWFTLIEILIVIAIAVILLGVSLRMNRSRIAQMQSQSERYQRHDRHNRYNSILTTNNYINNERVQNIQWIYSGDQIDLAIQTWIDNTPTIVGSFRRKHHTQNTHLTITKKAFELGCSMQITNDSTWNLQLTAWGSDNHCFTLDTKLCDFKQCK